MTDQRRKLGWVLGVVGALLAGLVLISLCAPDVSGERVTEPAIVTGSQPAAPLPGDDPLLQAATNDDDTGGQAFSLGGSDLVSLAWRLGLVIVIIAVSVVGLRWWGRKASAPKSTTGFLRVVDTLAVSNGRTIHLVALGERVIAVGATVQQLTLLSELTDDESRDVLDLVASPPETALAGFAAELMQSLGRAGFPRRARNEPSEFVIGEAPQ